MATNHDRRVARIGALLGVAFFFAVALPARAICMAERSYGAELDAADHVFLATITKASLDGDVATLRDEHPYRINYEFVVTGVVKGDPNAVPQLYGSASFDAPDGVEWETAESVDWQPGDVALIVAKGSGPVALSFCGPSKPAEWAAALLKREGRHDLDGIVVKSK